MDSIPSGPDPAGATRMGGAETGVPVLGLAEQEASLEDAFLTEEEAR
jgi:hypothetical protein